MTFPKRVLSLAAVLTALSSIASGYYHFVYFSSHNAPFNPINLHFDLTQLTNNTVYYFISDSGPDVFVQGDSFTGVISELQLAAQSWNNIPSSQIKLAYGGLEDAATVQSTPGIDVVFSDNNIAPGILAQTKVTTYANVSFINNATPFLPILRSQIQLRKNLTVTSPQQASFYDSSFTTMAHEFGHSLGLQHTLTSACMSTYVTRSTTKSMPIVADDVAGISLLYPAPNYLATTGSITGQVTLNGNGVNLASVVAISPITGAAISNLTNPDGTYRIDAIPPGPPGNYYLVYVHPLPPAQPGEAGPDAIVLPLDSLQNPFPANTGFVTQFSSGSRDWTEAPQIFVNPSSTQFVNFNVQASAGPVVSAMELWGYLDNNTTLEASPMLPQNSSYNMLFCAPGATNGSSQLAPGLNVSVIGSTAQIIPNYTKFYGFGNECNLPFVLTGVWTQSVQSTTPVALAVTVNTDLYVLPAAFFVVPSGPPAISFLGSPGTDQYGNSTITVFGSSLSSATQIVFDGAPANLISANGDGSLTVSVPPAPGPYTSSVEALNPDGQTSGQANPFGPPQSPYNYSYANPATINTISLSSVTPGTDTMIQITGSNTNFNSQTTVGFGTSDIIVKQVFVIPPTSLIVNVSVNSQAPLTSTPLTVTTGLQTATANPGIQIGPANPNQVSLHAPITNAATGLAGVPPGGTAIINATNLPQNLTGWILTIGGQPAQSLGYNSNGQLQATVPSGLGYGAQTVQLISPVGGPIGPTATIPPIAMKIDAQPPSIVSVLSASGTPINASSQVHPGDVLTINLLGLTDPTIPQLTLANIFASLGATTGPTALSAPVIQFNNPSIQVQIPYTAPNGTFIPLYVGVGTRVSSPLYLNIHN
jgi:predicted Zn-dependent protease